VLIEIRKAGFVNKGAHLMLRAAMHAVSARIPNAVFTLTPSSPEGDHPIDQVVTEGARAKLSIERFGLEIGNVAKVLPQRLRRRYGLALDCEVNAVLDAAGFAYGEPWPATNLETLARASSRWRKQGTKLILLPQSFGKFDSQRELSCICTIAANSTRVFARDAVSLEALRAATHNAGRLELSPDFTVSLPAIRPADATRWRETIAIVPNAKMLQRTDDITRTRYLPFLRECISQIESRGLRSAVVLHEMKTDRALAHELLGSARSVERIVEDDPQRLKGILGACHASIGSRYHGLVSCLSQGVPSLATSWSHKYQELLTDYGCSDAFVNLREAPTAAAVLSQLLDERTYLSRRERLLEAAATHHARAERMWDDVAELLLSR
jgi:polysaccharide pyruvyl transferase WcaK-like protein